MSKVSTVRRPQPELSTYVGYVLDAEDVAHSSARAKVARNLRVSAGGFEVMARRAVGCLVVPGKGDTVLVSVADDGRAWILSVLESDSVSTELRTEGDTLLCTSGELLIHADKGATLSSQRHVRLDGDTGSFRFGELSLLASKFAGRLLESSLLAGVAEGTFGRLVQTAKRVYRTVEELDHVRAGQVDYSAKGAMALRSDTAVLTAEKVVKVDAAQIVMG